MKRDEFVLAVMVIMAIALFVVLASAERPSELKGNECVKSQVVDNQSK